MRSQKTNGKGLETSASWIFNSRLVQQLSNRVDWWSARVLSAVEDNALPDVGAVLRFDGTRNHPTEGLPALLRHRFARRARSAQRHPTRLAVEPPPLAPRSRVNACTGRRRSGTSVTATDQPGRARPR